ncbi:MAG: hypothetical protein VX793_01915 [Pseudomonadota bacterium]|nr:hypothetical protein [Pseudomonadota bacterium]
MTASIRIARLVRAARRYPLLRRGLLVRALRLCQQALSTQGVNEERVLWLGIIWWQLGERRRGHDLFRAVQERRVLARKSP